MACCRRNQTRSICVLTLICSFRRYLASVSSQCECLACVFKFIKINFITLHFLIKYFSFSYTKLLVFMLLPFHINYLIVLCRVSLGITFLACRLSHKDKCGIPRQYYHSNKRRQNPLGERSPPCRIHHAGYISKWKTLEMSCNKVRK